MVSFVEKITRAKAELDAHAVDHLLASVEAIVRGQEAIGTAPLLDLLGLPKTTANGRRLARTMRTLGFVPIKSRRLMPGGYRDTVTRGWARPLRKRSGTAVATQTRSVTDGVQVDKQSGPPFHRIGRIPLNPQMLSTSEEAPKEELPISLAETRGDV